MASGGGTIAALWTEVNRCGQSGDFTRALKSVNKILQECKDDVTALNCKVVCLIQNGNFKEALNVIHTHNKVFGSLVHGSQSPVLDELPSAEDKVLKGQLYRLERYEECLTVYRDLIRNSQDDYEEERKTNLSAVVAALSAWEQAPPEDLGLPETSYELCYNSACTLIGQGRLPEAMKKLQEAEELCRQSLSEDSDMTEEDIDAELAVIHSQMAYVMQLQGRTEDALQLYNQVIKLKPTDVGLLAVTANNIITINKDQNVFDSKKKVKLTNADGVEHKLAKKQMQAIDFNKALLAMYTNQADQCRKLVASLQSQNPGHPRPVLIQVSQLCREKQHSKAIELLQRFSEKHPESASEIKLTMAQLYVVQGHVTKACDILRSIEDLKHKQGMISALVTMYSHEEDIDSAIDVFSQGIQHYQKHQPNLPAHLSLVREAANFKLKYGRKKEAISDLEQLWKLSKHLPSADKMSFNVDVDELENSHGATYVRKKAAKVTGEILPKEQGQGDIKKKKKKKKGKLPKNCDPKATPDPERWLPMRERSYYRGRKKGKKKEQVGKGTQGATSGASGELDASKTASSPPTSPRPGTAGSSNVVPPRQQKPATSGATRKKPQQKKKKGGKVGGSGTLRTYWHMYLKKAQDLEGACGITELHDALSLSEVGDERKLFIIGTHVKLNGSEVPSSVQDARELITQLVAENR
ncbi:Signal recognition particle subunit SRP72 [Acipenser ruthenus]|uniref:Signal recognition particle subunit SRP72 n=1 Tax=Acipenser ruthenus TaxID=7906 RepID=A0A444UFI9_ACIRT|nr:Signal recognition particle subunit SRP72 [Acipenser ruthenus]